MKHLRRNRTTSVSASASTPSAFSSTPPPVSASAPLAAAERTPHDAPLYARFTSARRGLDGAAPALKPLVSGPLALGPKKLVQAQAPVPVHAHAHAPSPPPVRRQRSSEGQARRRRDAEQAEGRAMGMDDGGRSARRGEAEVGEGAERAEAEVRRMASEGTALSSASGSGSGSGLGRHGTRVDGERVLLPARKLTQKRGEKKLGGRERTRDEDIGEGSSTDGPLKPALKDVGGEEVRTVGERVLLPARKVGRKVADADAEEGADGPSRANREVKNDEQARVVGERVLLPARKVTGKRADAIEGDEAQSARPTHSSSRTHARAAANENVHATDSRSAPSASKGPSASGRAHELEKTESVKEARTQCPGPHASSSSAIAFPPPPSSPSTAPAPAPAPDAGSAPVPSVARHHQVAAVVVIDPDGGEDKFSTPKRVRTHTLATTTIDAGSARHGASPSEPPRSPSRPLKSSWSEAAECTAPASNAVSQPLSTAIQSTSTTTTTTATATTTTANGCGGPPRRRKYSLRAAFGLPVASDADTSAGGAAAHDAKAPATPPCAPLLSPPAATTSSTAGSTLSTSTPPVTARRDHGARPTLHSIPRDSSAANRHARAEPEAPLQLQSLHLSGFDFPLEALLAADDVDADADADADAVPVPVAPVSVPQAPGASPEESVRAGGCELEQPSPCDPPVAAVSEGDNLPQPASSLPQPELKACARPPSAPSFSPSPSPLPPSSPSPSPSPAPAPARVAASPPPAPEHTHRQQHQQHHRKASADAQKYPNVPRTFDLDHSLLPPESDTRYPIPHRRSPTQPPPPPKPKRTSPQKMATHPHHASPLPPPRMSAMSKFPPTHRGPVQGRPLIFAAMAAAEAEAEIIEPKAWMAVATLDADPDPAQFAKRPAHTPSTDDDASQFVHGYPTPRSTSPKSPELRDAVPNEDPIAAPAMGRSISEPAANSPPAKDTAPRSPSTSDLQSTSLGSSGLPTPPEPEPRPRARKLSKSRSRVTRGGDAPQQPSSPPPSTLGAKPPTPVEDAPPPPRTKDRDPPSRQVHGSAPISATSASALGSPINLRNDRPLGERRSVESMRSLPPPPRVISSESPVPRRPVKVLTERQMEKLSATKGIAANGSSAPVPPSAAAKRRHEQGVPANSAPPQARSLPSQSAAQEERTRGVRSVDGSAPDTPKKKPPEQPITSANPPPHVDPSSPEEYAQARSRRRGKALDKARPEGIEHVIPAADPVPEPTPEEMTQDPQPAEEPEEPKFYPLEKHAVEPALLGQLLPYLTFSDWLALSSTSKAIRSRLHDDRELSERALERYLRTVGYARWTFAESEPLALTLTDLNAYMHSVSVPAHQFSRYAETYLQTENRDRHRTQRTLLDSLQLACRSYTRVVLRLRAQAEAEARAAAAAQSSPTSPARGRGLPSVRSTTSVNSVASPKKAFSRSTSRAPSPTSSYGHSYPGHARMPSVPGQPIGGAAFHSPLFRIRRAPLLQVFVPSPEGDWLSDTSVLECEKELKRAGVVPLLRPGDVVWDTAVGDEGNMGRMVWDGGYLIDLDYSYSRSGDLPKYLPTLAFPPSYFHRVVRTMGSGNPICHIDVAPWGEEIAANLQLIQDRVKTETPQGGHHMVVRWVHRSSFTLRPPVNGKPLRLQVPRDVGPGPGPGGVWYVDPGWYGTVVVEAEGTNEGLADLQARCRGAFPPRALGVAVNLSPERAAKEAAQKSVFRILREKSRPGEIWIRTVTTKERLLPP